MAQYAPPLIAASILASCLLSVTYGLENPYIVEGISGCEGEVCFCLNSDGSRISETERDMKSGFPDCKACKVQEERASPMPGAVVPQCTDEGFFQLIQRHGSTGDSWCVHQVTGVEVNGSRKARGEGDPNCKPRTEPDADITTVQGAFSSDRTLHIFWDNWRSDDALAYAKIISHIGLVTSKTPPAGANVSYDYVKVTWTTSSPFTRSTKVNTTGADWSVWMQIGTAGGESEVVGPYLAKTQELRNCLDENNCYCVHPTTRETVPGTWRARESGTTFCRDCLQFKEQNEGNGKALQCDEDGFYMFTQCNHTQGQNESCWHVDSVNGKERKRGSKEKFSKENPDMMEIDYIARGNDGTVFIKLKENYCDHEGYFNPRRFFAKLTEVGSDEDPKVLEVDMVKVCRPWNLMRLFNFVPEGKEYTIALAISHYYKGISNFTEPIAIPEKLTAVPKLKKMKITSKGRACILDYKYTRPNPSVYNKFAILESDGYQNETNLEPSDFLPVFKRLTQHDTGTMAFPTIKGITVRINLRDAKKEKFHYIQLREIGPDNMNTYWMTSFGIYGVGPIEGPYFCM